MLQKKNVPRCTDGLGLSSMSGCLPSTHKVLDLMLSTEKIDDSKNIYLLANTPEPKLKRRTDDPDLETTTQDPYLKSNRLLEPIQEYENGGKGEGKNGV